jgi:cation:H+ antiporter
VYNAAWPLAVHIGVFFVSAILVAVVGVRLTDSAARIARRTGLGQAVTGALFLGASTSLSGIITSVTAAAASHPELASSNAVGGIAAQTVFLAVADRVYRKANLEHAAASDENMLQGALLIALLSVTLLAALAPQVVLLGIHPVTVVLLLSYGFGQRLVMTAKGQEMWKPRITEYTQLEAAAGDTATNAGDAQEGEEGQAGDHAGGSGQAGDREVGRGRAPRAEAPLATVWARFAAAAVAIGILGYLLARSGVSVAGQTGLSETVLGGLFTAVATSFPELVTAVAAVRMGALTLAVSDIMGGNAFDVVFLAVADIAYRDGSLYHAMGQRPTFLIMLTILLTSILLMGLIRREKHGIANIGFESFLLFLVYAGGFLLIVVTVG